MAKNKQAPEQLELAALRSAPVLAITIALNPVNGKVLVMFPPSTPFRVLEDMLRAGQETLFRMRIAAEQQEAKDGSKLPD
jgi:hypothetical protein